MFCIRQDSLHLLTWGILYVALIREPKKCSLPKGSRLWYFVWGYSGELNYCWLRYTIIRAIFPTLCVESSSTGKSYSLFSQKHWKMIKIHNYCSLKPDPLPVYITITITDGYSSKKSNQLQQKRIHNKHFTYLFFCIVSYLCFEKIRSSSAKNIVIKLDTITNISKVNLQSYASLMTILSDW